MSPNADVLSLSLSVSLAQCGLYLFILSFAVRSGLWERASDRSFQLGAKKDGKLLGILRTPSADLVIPVSTLSSQIVRLDFQPEPLAFSVKHFESARSKLLS